MLSRIINKKNYIILKLILFLILILFFISSISYADKIKEFDIKGNDRVSDETIIIFSLR